MKLKKTLHHMLSMRNLPWYIFIKSLQLSCLMHFCSFVFLLEWNGSMMANYDLYMTAMSLQETGQAILLVAVLLSAIIESEKK